MIDVARCRIDEPAVRARLAQVAIRANGHKYTGYRCLSALSKGEAPGPENSIGKLVAATMMQEIATFAVDLMGAAGTLAGPEHAAAGGLFQAMRELVRPRRSALDLFAVLAERNVSGRARPACASPETRARLRDRPHS